VFAVRYVALVALVLWLGDLSSGLLGADGVRPFPHIAYYSGAIVFVSLFVMKFVGPPPLAFPFRAATVFVMMAIEVYSSVLVDGRGQEEQLLMACALLPGLSLLYWYVRE